MRQAIGQSFLTLVGLVATGLSALAFFGKLGWQIDLLAHFRFHALLGGIVLFAVVVVARTLIAALLVPAALALNAYALLSVPVAAKPLPGRTA